MGGVIDRIVAPKATDVGGFEVRRALPSSELRTVGPFVFVDEMGPGSFAEGDGLDVRPHPHIGLATATYLFDGAILHRDSLGTVQEVAPGDVNWMTAGRGIVHSERTGPLLRERGHRLHGIQAWVGLPSEHEERALYVVFGGLDVDGERAPSGALVILRRGAGCVVHAQGWTRVLLLGGAPLDGPRVLRWNFVASDRAAVESAERDWVASIERGFRGTRFSLPPEESEHISLPGNPSQGPPEPCKECPTT